MIYVILICVSDRRQKSSKCNPVPSPPPLLSPLHAPSPHHLHTPAATTTTTTLTPSPPP